MDVLKTYFSPTRVGGPAAPRGKAAEIQQQQAERYGIERLLKVFAAWKLFLLAIACASPGPGYDTSTQILFDQHRSPAELSTLAKAVEHLVSRLTRWDGIYFTSASLQGQVYEQEWAFSWALSKVTPVIARVFLFPLPLAEITKHALASIVLSHLTHALAVLTLYNLTSTLNPGLPHRKNAIAFTAATLHILSPAGLFLSAPYGESTFAFLNFGGMLAYIYARKAGASLAIQRQKSEAHWLILSGALFGIASTVRSNGLLSGMPFLWDACATLTPLDSFFADRRRRRKIFATVAAGALVAIGFVAPQVVAYTEHCLGGNTRPWCHHFPPSIYNWVQSHYWGVGFLKYWTPNNLPLFLLAAPMLILLAWTGRVAFFHATKLAALAIPESERKGEYADDMKIFATVLPRLAVPQVVLAVLALTGFHVQIINRISSGYAVWYIVLAIVIHAGEAQRGDVMGVLGKRKVMEWMVRAMVVYAVVQGGLFASFLPPA